MYTPTQPSVSSPRRQPSRYPATSATPTRHNNDYDDELKNGTKHDNTGYTNRPTTSGSYNIPHCPPSRGGQSASGGVIGRINTGNSSYSSVRLGQTYNSNSGLASCGREERTIVGIGTIGSGATWEAKQDTAKALHLEDWEKNKKLQESISATRKEEAKLEASRKLQADKERKRQMIMDNRFQAVTYRGGAGDTTDAFVRSRSAADRRERSVLPAAATSPLRQSHYFEVVKNKKLAVKEKAEWARELQRQHQEHEEYINAMRNTPLSSPRASSARGLGGASPARQRQSSTDDVNNGGNTPQRHSHVPSSMASPPSPRRLSAQVLPHLVTRNNDSGTLNSPGSRLNTPRSGWTTAGSGNYNFAVSGRETRTSSPPQEIAEQCHRVVMEERARIEADVQQQRDAELIKHRESRHQVVSAHYQTYKSVKDCTNEKADTAAQMAKEKVQRDKERKALVQQIREEKAVFQKAEREQTVNRVKTASHQRFRSARVNAEREDIAEQQRLNEREKIRTAELKALQESADARRVVFNRGDSPFSSTNGRLRGSPRRGDHSESVGRRGSSPQHEDTSFFDI